MRGRSILSLSLILVLLTVVVMSSRPVQATNGVQYLYVDGYDGTFVDWTTVGASPWLDAVDYPSNYVWESEHCEFIGFFTFEDLQPNQIITEVVIEGYTRSAEDFVLDTDVYTSDFVWLGSLWGTPTWGWHTPRWIEESVSDLVPDTLTVAGLNNFKVMLHYYTGDELSHGPFEIDSLRLKVYATAAISASIDVKPNSWPNSFSLKDQGLIPVAVFGSGILDVYSIDPESVCLGGVGAAQRGGSGKIAISFEDVDGDGVIDMVAFFDSQEVIQKPPINGVTGEYELMLTGTLWDATLITGTDYVRVV